MVAYHRIASLDGEIDGRYRMGTCPGSRGHCVLMETILSVSRDCNGADEREEVQWIEEAQLKHWYIRYRGCRLIRPTRDFDACSPIYMS